MAFKPKMTKDEKVRQWKIQKGVHKPKNRSSKDILRINHWPQRVDIYKSMSNATLQEMAKNDSFAADMEMYRREQKRAKKAAKKGENA